MSLLPEILENVSLQSMNTLRLPARARWFTRARSAGELQAALEWASQQCLPTQILGGGSNLVFAGDFDGLVIAMGMTGRHWEDVQGEAATLVLAAGENWHDAVLYAAAAGYRGIENLALIPGKAGAAPVQNIGAYGVELGDTLVSVTVLDRERGETARLAAADCALGYRDSIFKHHPGRYVILEIRLRLSRSAPLCLQYGELDRYFSGVADRRALTPLAVAEGVMAIRRLKLPDPDQLPNAGSFFKNPVVSEETWLGLRQHYPEMPGHPVSGGAKLAAAWLIDQCGWKGFRNSRVGVHNHQALVLVNHSGGRGEDILALAEQIRKNVSSRFGIALEVEPGIIGSLSAAEAP